MANRTLGKGDKPIKRAVAELASFPDDRLFQVVSEGISHIVTNATRLNEAALRLAGAGQARPSDILRGMAEEEAAKVLILVDAIRCPPEIRGTTLKRFYCHLAKRIYSAASSYPRIRTFAELRDFVDRQRRPRYLDGPNDIDWIFGNEILSEREQGIYVDFVRDTTDPPGDYFWSVPLDSNHLQDAYEPPAALTLANGLAEAGATSPDGLTVIADVWRDFTFSEETSRSTLQDRIERMLNDLIRHGTATGDQDSMTLVYSHWTFPLWSLDLSLDSDYPSIEELRDVRVEVIRRYEDTAAQRDPPPAIIRGTVEAMAKAYAEWEQETKEYDRRMFPHRQEPGPHFRCSSEFVEWLRLPSYARLKSKFRELETDERIALLALANFARERVPNWPYAFKHATQMVGHLDDDYQVSLGNYWLSGLDRWEADPPTFHVGQFFHH